VRVVNRVHRNTTGLGTNAHVALASGLANGDVLMVAVANGADSCAALGTDQAHFAGRQAKGCHFAVLGEKLN
jgi:hypothetical protein